MIRAPRRPAFRATLLLSAFLLGLLACSTGRTRRITAPPDDAEALALAATRGERWEEAAGRWNDIFLRGGEGATRACGEAALALVELGDYESAHGLVNLGLARDPAAASLHRIQGLVLCRQGFRRAAERSFERALELDPECPLSLLALGRVRMDLGLERSACEPLQRRMELGHADAETCILLADAERQGGDPRVALDLYVRSFGYGEPEADVLVRAALLGLDGRLCAQDPGLRDRSRAWLASAVQADPQHTLAHHTLGRMAEEEGRLDEAVARYRRAIETDPTYVPALLSLAELYARLGDAPGLRAMTERALELESDGRLRARLLELLERARELESPSVARQAETP